jgi:MFS transporter, OFA family, oxalate/formate antiporter
MCATLPLGSILNKSIGVRNTILVGGTISFIGVYISAFATSLIQFIMSFSVLVGIGLGLAYIAPMDAAWKWYPQSKGLVTGIILSGFGTGGFFLNILGSHIANPDNLSLFRGLFPDEVYLNFPVLLRTLSMVFLFITIICYFLITEPRTATKQEDKKVEETPGLDIYDAVRTVQFSVLWSMVFCSACAGLNASALYKQFAFSRAALAGIYSKTIYCCNKYAWPKVYYCA